MAISFSEESGHVHRDRKRGVDGKFPMVDAGGIFTHHPAETSEKKRGGGDRGYPDILYEPGECYGIRHGASSDEETGEEPQEVSQREIQRTILMEPKVAELVGRLRHELRGAVERNRGEGILLSGGLDSSIIALLSPGSQAFTVTLEGEGSDFEFARRVARHLKINWKHRSVSIKEALDTVPRVVREIRSFDPALPNDVATYLGLELAAKDGLRSVMTGDGADELFAGYDYMHVLNLDEYIPKIAERMSFSSPMLGRSFGIAVAQPFADRKFVEFTLSIPPDLKVKKECHRVWGKWILRKAFENELPHEVVWRTKTPIEFGSGMTRIRYVIEEMISEAEYRQKCQMYPIRFRSKEHIYYYEIYLREVGDIALPREGEKACCDCGAGVPIWSSHCRTCGGFPI